MAFFTIDSQAQSEWNYLPNAPAGGRLDDVFFLNEQLGWCVSGGGRIYKTTDAGQTWTNVYSTSGYFRSIEFHNENIGYAGSLNSKFLRTTDGGLTWTNLAPGISPVPEAICGISIPDSSVVYAVGQWDSPGFLLKSVDGGSTWVNQDMSEHAMALVDVLFFHRDTGFVTGQGPNGQAVILYTNDGGATWSKKYEAQGNSQYVWKIQRVTPEFWVGSIQTFNGGGKFVKSFDGGQTWTIHSAPIPDMQGIGFATPTHGWVGGYTLGFFETQDGGNTWDYQQFGGNFNRFFFLDSTLAYASGASVYKFSPNTSSSSEPPGSGQPYDDGFTIKLSPNPADQFIDIAFELPVTDNVRMSIHRADGAMVKEIYHKRQLTPGAFRFRVDIAGLAKGAYFIGVQRNHGLYSRRFSKP
ncbi:MAG: hypothetical protein IT261_01655 [Saprospiraceae bacterium]|nr:hypothetical protein [Saprospiraceae bacterium]